MFRCLSYCTTLTLEGKGKEKEGKKEKKKKKKLKRGRPFFVVVVVVGTSDIQSILVFFPTVFKICGYLSGL